MVETINVVSTGSSKNAVNITGTGNTLTTANISGDAQLTSTIASTSLTTVDASAATGKMILTTNQTTDMTVKGGSGNDTLTFTGTTYTNADTVDGGAGTDTLVIGTAITAASGLKNVSNVETLKMTGGADVTLAGNANVMTFDFTDTTTNGNVLTLNAGVTEAVTVTFGITQADQVNNAANTTLTVNGTATAIETTTLITGGTGTDTINMTADTNNDAAINITTQNVTLVDTINVLDNGDAAIAATSGALVRTSVSQLVHMLQLLRLMLLGSMCYH